MSEEHDQGYALVERFFIDEGELNGVSAERAFCLGVEFAQFREQLLGTREAFEHPVARDNVERILKMCWNNKRQAVAEATDMGEWVTIKVK